MDIETAATPAGGADTHVSASDTPAPEAQAPAEGNVAPQVTGGEGLDNLENLALPEAPEDDEYEEIERGDKKYRIPKPLKGELLMQQDYTRKTMELAEQRKALEAAKAEIEQARTLTTEERKAWGKLESLHEQVSAYEKVDWDALERADPVEAQRHWRLFQTAQNERNKTAAALQRQQAERTTLAQQEAAKRRQERDEQVAKEIPNWVTRKGELEKFAAQHGYTPEGLAENAGANDYKLLHLAEIGARFIERQRAAAKAAASGAVKPAPEVGGTAAAGIDPKSLSMEQYIAARNSGQI